MPHKSRVAVSDVPVDVMIELFRNPDSYQPMLDAWMKARREAQQAQADLEAAERQAEERHKAQLDEVEAARAALDGKATRFKEYAATVADGLIAVCNDTDDYAGVKARIRAAGERFENA